MSSADQNKLLVQLFRKAARSTDAPTPTHVLDDEELMLRWVEGDIFLDEHDEILEHLDQCDRCRKEIVAMSQAGVLILDLERDDMKVRETATARTLPIPVPEIQRRPALWTALAVAASLLVAAWLVSPPVSLEQQLAMAEQELVAGNPSGAARQLESVVVADNAAPELLERARGLLEESTYQTSKRALEQGHFAEVKAGIAQTSSFMELSGRLENMKIQASQGIDSEYSLDKHICDEHQPTGKTTNALADFLKKDPAADRLAQDLLHDAVEKHPDDVQLMLNYGDYLLKQKQYAKAKEQFSGALEKDAGNAYTYVGLGLLDCSQGSYAAAIEHFQRALEVEPDLLVAHMNLAICLERTEQQSKAADHWRKAIELTSDNDLRERIQRRMNAEQAE